MNKIASYIDHTLLKVDVSDADIKRHCKEAEEYGFYSVCVHPVFVSDCRKLLSGTDVKVVSVAGFPMGESLTKVKAFEAENAVSDGADEVDTVINLSKLFLKDYDYVKRDIKTIVSAIAPVPLKVILETCKLSDEQIVTACEICAEAGAAFVKTSTGFFGKGAEERIVRLMTETVRGRCRVKAAGGIRDYATAIAMIGAGASRIGTSAGVAIVKGEE